MLKTLRSYVLWTFARGSVQYDVMVTLILAFIFISPWVINYNDKPVVRTLPPHQILVQSEGNRGLMYQVDAATLTSSNKPRTKDDVKAELRAAIAPISGEVTIDRYQPMKTRAGEVIAYQVWAHR